MTFLCTCVIPDNAFTYDTRAFRRGIHLRVVYPQFQTLAQKVITAFADTTLTLFSLLMMAFSRNVCKITFLKENRIKSDNHQPKAKKGLSGLPYLYYKLIINSCLYIANELYDLLQPLELRKNTIFHLF